MNRIRDLRKAKGISAEALAEKLGISVPYLYEIERGEKRLNEDHLRSLVGVFETSTDYILGISDEVGLALSKSGKGFNSGAMLELLRQAVRDVLEEQNKSNR